MAQPVPTLDSRGYLKSIPAKVDAIMAYYTATNKDQSNEFRANIVSLQDAIAAYGSDMDGLCDAIQRDLSQVFNKYFDDVSLSVSWKPYAKAFSESEAITDIQISGTVTQAAEVQSINEALRGSGVTFTRLMPWASN